MRERLSIPKERVAEAEVTDVNDDPWGGTFRWILITLWVGSIIFFFGIYLEGSTKAKINYLSNLYLIIPLLGGLFGLYKVYKAQQSIRKTYLLAVWLFCSGLLLWAIGCAIGLYYNFVVDVEIPYATLGDAFFALCFLCWTAGIIVLYERAGKNVLYELNSSIAKFLVPLWGGVVTYIYLSHRQSLNESLNAYSSKREIITFILDIFFPIIDLFNLGLLITLLPGPGNDKLHIKGRPLRLIVIGYFFLCLASSSFTICRLLPETSPYRYYNGGFTDIMFATAFTILSIGISLIPLGQIIRAHESEARDSNNR